MINKLLVSYSQYISKSCFKSIKSVTVKHNSIILLIFRKYIASVCTFLKNHTNAQYRTLLDIVVVDYPLKKNRFEVSYVLLSTLRNSRLILKTQVSVLSSVVSITKLYLVASWLEREVWDMFGIFFIDNFDLRRILTDYGFEGYPFRKDFPLSGYVELRYDENQKRIVSEFVEVSQEYRYFDFL